MSESTESDPDAAPDGFNGFLSEQFEPDPENVRIIDRYTTEDGERIRLVACYSESSQQWLVRKQACRDREWRTSGWAMRLNRNGPSEHPDRVDYLHNRFVKSQAGMFSGLPFLYRLVLAPLYGLTFAVMCWRGKDVNVQTLHDEDWTPDE